MKLPSAARLLILFLAGAALPLSAPAQENRAGIDKSRINAQANNVKDFVPSGWKIEEQVSGDLNGDSMPDYAVKLVESKRINQDDVINDRQRALVILLKNKAGGLSRAAVADKLLQCTGCGGAFYGVVEAPANVRIERGVLVVNQDHGSRNVTEATYRFRYDAASGKFILIGLDVIDNDRVTGETVSESRNYLTGVKITERIRSGKGRKAVNRSRLPRQKISIEQVDHERFEQVDR
ncbi:MAG TPA: hypothetical protein VF723_15265 [Pyrinomonadaceae bacterium]|jgi:hypothetical protein